MNSDNLEPLSPEDLIRLARQEWAVSEFLHALGPSSAPPVKQRWTAEEWAHLNFLRYRIERGLVPA